MESRAGPNTSSERRSYWNSDGEPCWSEYQQRTAVVTEIMFVSRCIVVHVSRCVVGHVSRCVVVHVFIPDRLGELCNTGVDRIRNLQQLQRR